MTAGIRTLHVSPEALLDLLKAVSAGKELQPCGATIPPEAGLAGVSYDPERRIFEIGIASRWPDDNPAVEFRYRVRHANSGTNGDWGMPRVLAEVAT